ncbi:TetR/AcrR family transcriptional regulator [Dactylosporangium sp. CS-033363]|uniref:TetR/AcrR family transcriptional regulator n=1 Tax=Dactylosporangium sp. CS-033363 TaxID=3239935 RepID=UPI003D90CF6D
MTDAPARRRRADAQRSVDAILAAAHTVLGARPDAGMEEIAAAASVTRQTVYAHFASRDALIAALIESAGAETVGAIAAAGLDTLPPIEALQRYLELGWDLIRRHPYLLSTALSRNPPGSESAHAAGTGHLERLIERGRQSGDFDRTLPAAWLAAAVIGLAHTAADELRAGRLGADEAYAVFAESAMRVCEAAR